MKAQGWPLSVSDCEGSRITPGHLLEVKRALQVGSTAFDWSVDLRGQWAEVGSPVGDGKCQPSAVEDVGGAGLVHVKIRV